MTIWILILYTFLSWIYFLENKEVMRPSKMMKGYRIWQFFCFIQGFFFLLMTFVISKQITIKQLGYLKLKNIHNHNIS